MSKMKCGGCGGDYYTSTEQCDTSECGWFQYDKVEKKTSEDRCLINGCQELIACSVCGGCEEHHINNLQDGKCEFEEAMERANKYEVYEQRSNIEFKNFLENLLKFMNDKAKSNEVRVNIPNKRGIKYTSYTLKNFIELELEELK